MDASEQPRPAPGAVALDHRYTLEAGRAYMSGVQALVRLPMQQQRRDARAGLHTAGLVSGYRGSPLGGYDLALWKARDLLVRHDVVFQPGINEELAATAVWGSQQLDLQPGARRYDGVFGIWYGKGPGVDRCGDVFKHANMDGTARHGGVVAVAGDDHIAKSSTIAHQSDHAFKAAGLPLFFPASVQEILDLGLHAIALSRYSGLWAAMKTIQEIVESSAVVDVDLDRVRIALPTDFEIPAGGVHIRRPDDPLAQEARLMEVKWYAALAYIRANRLNRTVIDSPRARLGIMASGKAYNDTRQALADLGLDDAACARLGLRLHKVAVVWPLEASATRAFAAGLQEILVVEEKRQVLEYQLKEELYNWRDDVRPNVLGKFHEGPGDRSGGEWSRPDPGADWLLPAHGELDPARIARAIASRLERLGLLAEADQDLRRRIADRLAVIDAKERTLAALPELQRRPPWFCPGCPHNTGTRVPEGSRAVAGIGCHYMALWMDRNTTTFTQMGGEGATWVGQAPFSRERHVFVNLGDGTYVHSGLLAIRQAIAAGVDVTYKILFNGAVAMTGGQPVEGPLDVARITRELQAEGAWPIVVLTEEPARYRDASGLAAGVEVLPRDAIDAVQLRLRDTPGTSVMVFDQGCAAEKRHHRKRGLLEDPARAAVINPLVCEGCGDCSEQSNCLAVEPLETEFGRKRRINPDSCNKDFSCLRGFCPSFVTVEGGRRRTTASTPPPGLDASPEPPPPRIPALPGDGRPWSVLIAGVGGTGIVTIGQLLGVAAHVEGRDAVTLDATGLAQKGGATWSHVQIADRRDAIRTTKIAVAEADLLLACDAVVAADRDTLSRLGEGRTRIALNTHATPTAAFVHQRDWDFPAAACRDALERAAGPGRLGAFDADAAAARLLGDAVYANAMLLGYAWQLGWIPLREESLLRAVELNAVAVERNRAAFAWGRRAAADPGAFEALGSAQQVIRMVRRPSLDEMVRRRVDFLTRYQSAAYAAGYADLVARIAAAEAPLHSTLLAEAAAQNLFRLMAYKDEYEVARLHRSPEFAAAIERQFEGDFELHYHLAPPLLGGRDAQGRPRKREFGPWMGLVFALLQHGRHLRGTPFDPFGRSAERRLERELLRSYRDDLESLIGALSRDRLALALRIARMPEGIRGFGPVKMQAAERVRAQWDLLRREWRSSPAATATRATAQSRA